MSEFFPPRVVALPPEVERLARGARFVGMAGTAALVAGWLRDPAQFHRSYLLGVVFWSGLATGCLALLMVQHLTGGAWGLVIRRVLESATRTLPLMALLFVPIAFGLPHVYVWARPETAGALQHRQVYLNGPFFLGRTGLYFAAWMLLAYFLNRWSREEDDWRPPPSDRRFRLLSAPGLVVYGLTTTFAGIDWVMSLDPYWGSTIFGVLIMGGQGLSALAFAVVALYLVRHAAPLASRLHPQHFHDLGNLLLAFVLLWTYFAFSQFLIVWSGNLPEEITWYVRRRAGGWPWVAALIALAHFAVPFLLLLVRTTKRHAARLAAVATLLLGMRMVDTFYLIVPEFHPEGVRVHWMDFAALSGLGGWWLTAFARQLAARPLLPRRVTEVGEADA